MLLATKIQLKIGIFLLMHGDEQMPRLTKKNLALLKQIINISKEDMEDYN
jgi:hypothetical protein